MKTAAKRPAEPQEELAAEEQARPLTGPMNRFGRWLIVEVLAPEGILFRRSEAANSITIENPTDWIKLVAWYGRRSKTTEIPAYIRRASQTGPAEIAVMITDGDHAVRLRAFDDVAQVISRHAKNAFGFAADGKLIVDPRRLPTDLVAVTRDFAALDPLDRRIP
jgi:hypothetical protein